MWQQVFWGDNWSSRKQPITGSKGAVWIFRNIYIWDRMLHIYGYYDDINYGYYLHSEKGIEKEIGYESNWDKQ